VTECGSSGQAWSDPGLRRIDDFCLIADLAGVDLLICDPHSKLFVACNRLAHTHLGYSREQLLALGPEAIQADPDHNAAWLDICFRKLLAEGGSHLRTRHRCRDNSVIDVEVASRVVSLEGRQLVVSTVWDRTTAQQREQQLQDTLDLVCAGESISGVGSWDLRFADGRMRWSPQMRSLCRDGSTDELTTLWAYGTLVHPEDRSRWRQDLQRAMIRGEVFHNRHRLTAADGSDVLVEQEAHFTYDPEGQPERAVGIIRDLGPQQNLQEEQSWNRCFDPLTGLPNKLAALTELDRRLIGRSYNNSLAVFSLDVDGFQEINDNFGSDVGDQLLKAMALKLKELLNDDAWIGRLSSDQFVIILEEHIHSLGDAVSTCRQLQKLWSAQERILSTLPLVPTFSIGLATYPEHAQAGKALMQCANTALMKAKAYGRVQICSYSSTISRQIQERLELSSDLTQAINRNQLRIVVQPQLDRANQINVGEVLLRWKNHLGRSISPSHFIPLAEESGLIFPISDWVLRTTLQQLQSWQQAGLQAPRLALNLSPRELELPGRSLIRLLLDGLNEHNLSPEQLELEITETAQMSNPLMAREQLRALAEQGFRIALDDFGTGYSSLELVRTLPIHRLKIDRTFVERITTSAQDQTIVRTAITLAQGLGMNCIAEGVETEEQHQLLMDLGCDFFQGYLWGMPMELDDFEELLNPSAPPDSPEAMQSAIPITTEPLTFASPIDTCNIRNTIPRASEQLEMLRTAFDAAEDPTLLLQVPSATAGSASDFVIVEANLAACRVLSQDSQSIVGQTMLAVLPHTRDNGLFDLFLDAAARQAPMSITDFVYRNHEIFKNDRCFDIQILPAKGVLVTTWRDVTERSRAARSLADAAALYQLLTENIVEVVALLNDQEQVIWVSPSLQPMTGWRQNQWQGKPFRELFGAAEGAPEPVGLGDWLRQEGMVRQGRLRLADPRGGWTWVQLSVRRLKPNGLRSLDGLDTLPIVQGQLNLNEGYVLTLQPVDAQVLEERRLRKRANTDPLTGLESRASILDWLEQRLLEDNGRTAQPLALLFCDFDDFKGINDTYGHACGDVVLQTVAGRIERVIRQRDHAGRLGGDEMLVLLDGIRSLEAARHVAAKLHALFCEPIPWCDLLIHTSASIGVALHGAGEDADLFLKRADHNMYAAKAAGRGRVIAL
jgi:diguanylate cyclase (GGDEF)-like protein